jgi:hypothetical protein
MRTKKQEKHLLFIRHKVNLILVHFIFVVMTIRVEYNGL